MVPIDPFQMGRCCNPPYRSRQHFIPDGQAVLIKSKRTWYRFQELLTAAKKDPCQQAGKSLSLGYPSEKKAKGRILDHDDRQSPFLVYHLTPWASPGGADRNLFFVFGLGLGLELLDTGKSLLWVFLGFIDAAFAAQENRLILDQNLHRDPHRAEAVVGFDGAPLLGLGEFAIFFGQLGQIGLDGGFLILRRPSPNRNKQGA